MSISFRFWILFGVVVTSSFISVYCSAAVEILVQEAKKSDHEVHHGQGLNNVTTATEVAGNNVVDGGGSGSGSNRSVFARCFSSMWEWIQDKASASIYGIVEDKIISGNPDNVKFYLYPNPENKDFVEEIVYGDPASLKKSHYRSNLPLKIIIHGFTNHHISEPVQQIKNAYLTRELHEQRLLAARPTAASASGGFHGSRDTPEASSIGYNVIIVDWGQLADPKFSGDVGNIFYQFAVHNVPVVGRRVAEFVMFLVKYGMLRSLDEVHLIGFSLGSHVSGNAGNILKELTDGQQTVGRISGLDPAGPSFYQGLRIASRQLSSEDAKFVDIIHTNQGALGIYKNIGHVDFFPNGGGPLQKPCLVEYGQSQNENAAVVLNTCSHSKAPFFFSLSINRILSACRCESLLEWKTTCPCKEKAIFGEFCDYRTRGTFYLDLNE